MKKTNATLFITLLLSAPFITACTESNMKHTAGSSTNHSAKPQSAAALLPTMKWQLISHQASGQNPSNILKAGDAANRYHVSITGNLNVTGNVSISGTLTQAAVAALKPHRKAVQYGIIWQSTHARGAYFHRRKCK